MPQYQEGLKAAVAAWETLQHALNCDLGVGGEQRAHQRGAGAWPHTESKSCSLTAPRRGGAAQGELGCSPAQ